jgi:hypothetical protein
MTETEQLQAEVTRLQEELRLALAAWRWALARPSLALERSGSGGNDLLGRAANDVAAKT